MNKYILALATATTLFAGSFVLPSAADAQPRRYWGGPHFGGSYNYQPYYYRRPYPKRDYGGRVNRYDFPGTYQGGPQTEVDIR
jgi:hypothetical protein